MRLRNVIGIALLLGMVAATQVPSSATAERRFSVLCSEPSTSGVVDPFSHPTLPDHRHTFFGSLGMRSFPATLEEMRSAGTTCEFSGDTATYWVPEFMTRNGAVLEARQVLVYYRHNSSKPVVPHEPDRMLKSFNVQWGCVDSDNFNSPPDCSDRDIRMRVVFAPEKIAGGLTPRIAMNVRYPTRSGAGGHLMAGSAGPHGNFWNTWQQPEYKRLVDLCLARQAKPSLCFKVSD